MTPRDKPTPQPAGLSLAPLDQAVIESIRDGVVVFDPQGRVVYANEHARRAAGIDGEAAAHEANGLRARLLSLGGHASALRSGTAQLGEVVFLPGPEQPHTLADRERQAIVDTLRDSSGRLAETARRLGISRTTLWRRLKAYGLHPNGRARSSTR